MKSHIVIFTILMIFMGAISVSAQDTTECEDGFRLFENENIVEAICVPETAERIVTLDPFYSLQMSLEMNLPVMGSGSFTSDGGFPDTLSAEVLAGIEVIGAFDAPNLEAIVTLAPDLIIGDAYFLSEQYELLNEIAPTVLIATANWKAWYRTIAAAAGVPERAEAAFDAYNTRIADLQARIPDDVTVSFLRVVPDGYQLYREAPNAYAPIAVMSEAGVVRPEFESGTDEESFARLDDEGLTYIEGDILLYVVGGSNDDGEQLEAETLSNPIWQALPAVEAGQAYRVDAGPWMSFGGLRSAHAVLDDLFRYVAGVDPQEVSPNPFLTNSAATTEEASITSCEAGFRLFDHEYLAGDPICIPENPQRILALEISALEMVLFTNKELVGTAGWLHEEVPVLMPELAPALEGIADTGYPANLEVALLAAPDLILAVDGDIDLDAAQQIAPVVMPVAGLEYDWRLSMEFWSEVLGTQDLYADMVANYEARIAEFQEALTDDPTISIIGTSSYGTYMWLEDTAPGVVVADAGLERPESQALSGEAAVERYGEQRWIQISEERFDLADADAIFVFTYATTDPETLETENAAMETFRTNPVWNSLSAVEAGHVYYVGPHWWRAQTYLLANKVLDDLFTHLTGSSADTPVLNFAD
ncbi:iron-siderophore ABC transporter substrate-binding protein [Anaerolineae bacterium CFX9]|nr:iron-siderophore ABC transporter substrate-binding protein [Anaerolineae bacterium CFX9]